MMDPECMPLQQLTNGRDSWLQLRGKSFGDWGRGGRGVENHSAFENRSVFVTVMEMMKS